MKFKRKDFKRIHDASCEDWKLKLIEWYGRKFAIEDTIEIKESECKLMRDTCTDGQHKLFDEIFGEVQDITDKVKTVDDAIKLLGENDEEVKELRLLEKAGSKNLPFQKLVVIIKSLNEGWTPNWDNNSEYKYYPYFNMGGFLFHDSFFYRHCSNVSDRLCLKSSKLSDYCGKHFNELYKEYMK